MKVCIAEKPSVARDLAKVLGANNAKKGYIEGNGYQITWTFGHFCTLKQPHEYEPYLKQWRLETIPFIPEKFGISLIENNGVKEQFEVIRSLVSSPDCQEVINCGDAGQEGELIQRWVLLKAQNQKPVKRLWISSLTEEAIKEGFNNLKDQKHYDNLYAAGSARALGDWLLGINATRLFTLKYAPPKQVLSIGRVQTPTLALIVNRQLEIQNFVSEKYFELKTKYKEVLFSSDKGKFDNKEKGEELIEKIANSLFEITSFSVKKGKEAPLKLFDLTSLQVECNRKFSMSADHTLKIIQSLYEKKFVTYPRVDTQYLPDDMYPKIPQILRGLPAYSQFTEVLLDKKIIKPKRVFDNSKISDHHAIIPTGVVANGMSRDENDVYDLLTRRFIAAFYPDAVISNTEVLGVAAEIKFKATGRQIIEDNWRVLYPSDNNKEVEGEEKQLMPIFVKGESGPHFPELQEKNTTPPKYYTEATLLRAMETAGKQVDDDEIKDALKENGIGRPSTRAAIIETLFKRQYISKTRKRLEATPTGMALIGTIKNELLKSVELTGQWEKKLRQIERGEYSVDDFKSEMTNLLIALSNEVKHDRISNLNQVELPKKSEPKLLCPKCGNGEIISGKKAFGCNRYKDGCDFTIPFEISGKKISSNQLIKIVNNKKSDLLKGFSFGEIKRDGYLILNDDFNIEFEEQKILENKCPKCGGTNFLKGKKAFGCSNYINGCDFVIPFEIANCEELDQLQLNDEMINKILKK